jgi:hypothetical protein
MDYADNIIFDLFVEDFHDLMLGEDYDPVDSWLEKQDQEYDRRLTSMTIKERRDYISTLIVAVEIMLDEPEIIDNNINNIKSYVNAKKFSIPSRYYPLKCKQTIR